MPSMEELLEGILQTLDEIKTSGNANLLQNIGATKQYNGYRNAPVYQKATVDATNSMQLFYATGGIFTDCDLEMPVMNTTLQPQFTLLDRLVARPTILQSRKWAFVTQVTDSDNPESEVPPTTVCEDCPSIGDIATCVAEFNVGRLCYETRTGEIDALIRKASLGVPDNLYFVGDVRGVSAVPTRDMLGNADLVKSAAVRRQLMLVGRRFQRTLGTWVWIGSPDDATQNTNPGAQTDDDAWRAFWGMDYLIADDYDSKGFVTGTNCEALNSLVVPYDGTLCTDAIFPYLQDAESRLYNRAVLMSLLPVTWEIWMHPTIWAEMVKCLPCEMVGDGCSGGVINANDGGTGLFNLATRQQMQRTMSLDLNGRTYPVRLDHFIPYIANLDGSETSSIYFIPFNVAGEEVLFMQHMDYTQFGSALSPIPGTQDLYGWTDSGRFHHTIIRDSRCFKINTKIEPGLVFRAPHLAARIDGVSTPAPLVPFEEPIEGSVPVM